MQYRRFGEQYYVRLDPGDEIIRTLSDVCAREGLTTASIHGIGGCDTATVGVFDRKTKSYHPTTVTALLEMVSLDGNLTRYEGAPYLHLHALFAYRSSDENAVLTGHLLEAVIGLTGEIVITPADGVIGRRYIDELGIRVWDFEPSE